MIVFMTNDNAHIYNGSLQHSSSDQVFKCLVCLEVLKCVQILLCRLDRPEVG